MLAHPRFFVVLALHSELDPPAVEWDAAVAQVIQLKRRRQVSVDCIRLLVLSDGGAPNALQRRRYVRELHDGLPCKVAVLTSSLSNPVKRGIATALSWANALVRFYAPRATLDALSYLELLDHRDAILIGVSGTAIARPAGAGSFADEPSAAETRGLAGDCVHAARGGVPQEEFVSPDGDTSSGRDPGAAARACGQTQR